MKDIRTDGIVANGWDNISKEDLEFLYFEKRMIKREIASLFNVSHNQVKYKLTKYDLNLQRKIQIEGLKKIFGDIKKQSLQELIFAGETFDEDIDGSALSCGPVKVLQGRYKGRIGCLDDEDRGYGYIHWGDMAFYIDSAVKIKSEYLSNHITTYDYIKRAEELKSLIARTHTGHGDVGVYEKTISLFSEYTYIISLLNQIYEETIYQNNGNKKRVFLSYSSLNKDFATWIATDLKRARYQVWFDSWEIDGGHNIIDEIGIGIEKADALVMLVSKSYINSAMCKTEWQSYFMTKYKNQPNSIIPILLDDTTPPTILSSIRYLKLSSGYDYDFMLKELKRALIKL